MVLTMNADVKRVVCRCIRYTRSNSALQWRNQRNCRDRIDIIQLGTYAPGQVSRTTGIWCFAANCRDGFRCGFRVRLFAVVLDTQSPGILYFRLAPCLGVLFGHRADVAQLAEQLFCKQQVAGSSPIVGSKGRFPSGQRGLAVNQVRKLRGFESLSPHRACRLR